MNREDALKTLRLDAEHDAHAIEQSYWSLVRRAQSQDDEYKAQLEIGRLNAAYALLAPAPEPQAVTADRRTAAYTTGGATSPHPALAMADGVPEAILAWFAAEAQRISVRWRGRIIEAVALFGAVMVLAVLALVAGAPFAIVLVCTAIAAAIVWAPWRTAEPISPDDQ